VADNLSPDPPPDEPKATGTISEQARPVSISTDALDPVAQNSLSEIITTNFPAAKQIQTLSSQNIFEPALQNSLPDVLDETRVAQQNSLSRVAASASVP